MKKKHILLIAAISFTSYLFIFCCNPEIIGSVENTLRPQETANWCWAAVTQMLAEHEKIYVKQCDLSNYDLGRSDCCDPENAGVDCPKRDECNQPGWPLLDYVGLAFDETNTALSWADIQKQIYCYGSPMGYAYGTTNIVGHVVLIKGYVTLGGTDYVVLNDPWGPCIGEERLITYAEYANPAGPSTHWSTFYNIEKK